MGRTFRLILLTISLGLGLVSTAKADDGCTVLLCLAGNWKQIDQCVPPVKKALRDLALGRGLPTCDMASASGAGSTGASNRMLNGESCPPQYTVFVRDGDANITARNCLVSGAITVSIDGVAWSITYWNGSDSATWFSDQARSGLGTVDSQYDTDLAAWRDGPGFLEWDCIVNGNCPAVDAGTAGGGG